MTKLWEEWAGEKQVNDKQSTMWKGIHQCCCSLSLKVDYMKCVSSGAIVHSKLQVLSGGSSFPMRSPRNT